MHDGPFKKTIPQSGWVSTKVTKDYNFCGSNGIPIFELYKVLFPQSCLLVANQFTIVILLMISTINQHTQPILKTSNLSIGYKSTCFLRYTFSFSSMGSTNPKVYLQLWPEILVISQQVTPFTNKYHHRRNS